MKRPVILKDIVLEPIQKNDNEDILEVDTSRIGYKIPKRLIIRNGSIFDFKKKGMKIKLKKPIF